MGFYGPRILDFFNQTAALIALISAVFAFTILQRSNEITAIEAAGASKYRIIKPILVTSIVIVGVVALSREFVIPGMRDALIVDLQDLTGDSKKPIQQFKDYTTGLGIKGGYVQIRDREIVSPIFNYFADQESPLNIVAEKATFEPPNDLHPGGYMVYRVSVPKNLSKRNTRMHDDQPVVFFPGQHEWLKSNQCFVAMNVPPHLLVSGPDASRYAPIQELIATNRHPSVHFSNRQRVEVHSRIVQPLMDLTLICLGLPIVIARRSQNLFVAAGICMAIVIGMLLTTLTFQGLGATRIITPPALAAWMPVIIFTPLAFAMQKLLKK